MISGMIAIWSGAIVDIPTGYALCDGNNGTPDLRNKFVPGSGDSYAPGDSGGSDSQTHGFTSSDHNHVIPNTMACPGAGASLCLNGTNTSNATASGTTDSGDNRPQYYSLCYIMKL